MVHYCGLAIHNTAKNSSDNLIFHDGSYPPDNHHGSHVVYCSTEGEDLQENSWRLLEWFFLDNSVKAVDIEALKRHLAGTNPKP